MQRAAYRFGVIATLLLSICLISGCSGSSDPLDEAGWRWDIREQVVVQDGDEERHQIDLLLSDDASIIVKVESNEDVDNDLYVHEIILEFTLAGSNSASAPEIATIRYPTSSWLDRNGGSITYTLIFLTSGDKQDYLSDIGGEAAFATFWADYHVDITIHGSFSDDSDNDVTIRDNTWFTVIQTEEEEEATP